MPHDACVRLVLKVWGPGLFLCLLAATPSWGQRGGRETSQIQDNSFLVEEAYNQEPGVVQHISTFSRMWNSKDWSYTFTQEWPLPRNPRHQLSYTIAEAHSGAFAGSGAGIGDLALHYRYQLVGGGDSRLAFAPRISVLAPTGDAVRGRGAGSAGIQINLPLSVALHPRLVAHSNVGSTLVPNAQDADHCRAATAGYTLGQSLVFLATPRFNLLVESIHTRYESVVEPGRTEWLRMTYISPGVRWAYNVRNGLQIVPGIAVPLGVGASAGERGLFLYLSFEHPVGSLFSRR